MDREAVPSDPAISLLRAYLGLGNRKDAVISHCQDRKYGTPPSECTLVTSPAGRNTGHLFLMFGRTGLR